MIISDDNNIQSVFDVSESKTFVYTRPSTALSRLCTFAISKPTDLSQSEIEKMAPHCCIIGAGVSGLRCATVLLENSYDVTVIEGRNRIGGRVRVNGQSLITRGLTPLQIAQSDCMGPLDVDM